VCGLELAGMIVCWDNAVERVLLMLREVRGAGGATPAVSSYADTNFYCVTYG
jgi:hypothetical protein